MTTSCLVLLNKAGIVAASDADFSIRPLSRSLPVLIAVDAYSAIPWNAVIDDYMIADGSRSFSTLREAYDSFSDFFRSRCIEGSKSCLRQGERVLFMGYDKDVLYPSLIGSEIDPTQTGSVEFGDFFERRVHHGDPAFFSAIGDLDYVSPILAGVSDPFLLSAQKNELRLLSDYQKRLLTAMSGMGMERKWLDRIRRFDMERAVDEKIRDSVMSSCDGVARGMDTLSIQEMTIYAESLVNAEARLRGFRKGEKSAAAGVREIAVATIPEGLTWIRHSLFAI